MTPLSLVPARAGPCHLEAGDELTWRQVKQDWTYSTYLRPRTHRAPRCGEGAVRARQAHGPGVRFRASIHGGTRAAGREARGAKRGTRREFPHDRLRRAPGTQELSAARANSPTCSI